jgi:hypothetical protein
VCGLWPSNGIAHGRANSHTAGREPAARRQGGPPCPAPVRSPADWPQAPSPASPARPAAKSRPKSGRAGSLAGAADPAPPGCGRPRPGPAAPQLLLSPPTLFNT